MGTVETSAVAAATDVYLRAGINVAKWRANMAPATISNQKCDLSWCREGRRIANQPAVSSAPRAQRQKAIANAGAAHATTIGAAADTAMTAIPSKTQSRLKGVVEVLKRFIYSSNTPG